MADSSVSDKLSNVHSQIQNFRRDVDHGGFDQMHKRIDAQQQDSCALTCYPQGRVQNQSYISYSLLALQNYSILQDRKAAIGRALIHKSILFNMMSAEEKEQLEARAEVGDLSSSQRKFRSHHIFINELALHTEVQQNSMPPWIPYYTCDSESVDSSDG